MNNVQYRFTDLEALKHAHVDTDRLKASGKLEVGGKVYQVTSAENGQISVERQAQHRKFFSAAGQLFGKTRKLEKQDLKEQISQTLEGKQRIGNSVSGSPSLERMNAGRFGAARLNIEQVRALAAGEVGLDRGTKALDSLTALAEKPVRDEHGEFGSIRSIYDLYRAEKPAVEPMSDAQKTDFLDGLKALNQKPGVEIWPQLADLHRKDFDLDAFIDNHPRAKSGFYCVAAPGKGEEDSQARLTLNVKPGHVSELMSAMAEVARQEPNLVKGKITAPNEYGRRPDVAILYVKGDVKANQALAEKIRQSLPSEAWLDHNPAGMHPLSPGVYYAETAVGDESSHGMSRAAIIHQALQEDDGTPLESRLQKAIINAGYHPDNPAFLADSVRA